MENYESFGECLKRCLEEEQLSASEAARLVGFRSRNSIFRILQGNTSDEINSRFLDALRHALGDAWPAERWRSLVEALTIDRIGLHKYQSNRAFEKLLHAPDTPLDNMSVCDLGPQNEMCIRPFSEVLDGILQASRIEFIITGCCDLPVMRLLAQRCAPYGEQGRLTMRHYIDTTEDLVVGNIVGVMPLVGKNWYNARLVGEGSCPAQMHQLYRLNAIYINCWDADGQSTRHQLICVSETEFVRRVWDTMCPTALIVDKWRFHLELLKPTAKLAGSLEAFLEYTNQYAQLEENCPILSIKPDVHFNCIPPWLLERSIREGFSAAGFMQGDELEKAIGALWQIHEQRWNNMISKHKPTHLVYSLPEMEKFMRTGMLSDHFFIQTPYSVPERREIIRLLRSTMLDQPYFNVHFLRDDIEVEHEISCYSGKGVMIMDAHTNYDFPNSHSEALITLPVFMKRFQEFFYEELLKGSVLSREQTLRELERLMLM